jgi:hypothetical protein
MKSSEALVVSPTSEIERAEALLHDIAIELLRVPMHGAARELHVRALRLKRQVATWTPQVADTTVQATLDQLLALHRQARDARLAPVAPVARAGRNSASR